MVISSINCYLESNELISIIIEGKLNYEHYHIGTYGRVLACGIWRGGGVLVGWGLCMERDFDELL